MAGGDTYVIIYLKMQLKALRTDGVLEYTGVEPDFVDELALDLDEAPDDVRMTLAYLMTYGLCECSDNIHYFLSYVVENTGSETASTQRVRDYRERQRALHCNADETQVKRICNVEIEKEKRDRDKSRGRKFTPPTLDQVKAYAKEANLNIDCEKFYTYFTTPNDAGQTWIDSKGNPVRNWKQKMITWANKGEQRTKSRNTLLNYNESQNVKDVDLNLDEL
jgi:predicted phage replisome organizer